MWAVLGCFGFAVLSAVFPWFSVEIIVLALPAMARTRVELAALVLVVVAGQMAGKGIVYWGARRGRQASPRTARTIERWALRLERWHSRPATLVFLSSAVGFPPFFLITAFAGAARWNFGRFLIAGAVGRLIRFGLIVAILPSG